MQTFPVCDSVRSVRCADVAPHESEDKIYEEVKNSAYEIIPENEATYYGIAMAVKESASVS